MTWPVWGPLSGISAYDLSEKPLVLLSSASSSELSFVSWQ